MGYRMINGKAYPVGEVFRPQSVSVPTKNQSTNKDFKEILNSAIDERRGFKVSKHAEERLKSSNFSENDMKNIGKGFEIAEDKGSKNSVMLYKDVALVTSIENKTVITAVNKDRAEENIFTNIDSVVIL